MLGLITDNCVKLIFLKILQSFITTDGLYARADDIFAFCVLSGLFYAERLIVLREISLRLPYQFIPVRQPQSPSTAFYICRHDRLAEACRQAAYALRSVRKIVYRPDRFLLIIA